MTPLETFRSILPSLTTGDIEHLRETLKGSVGGGVKTPTEAAVVKDQLKMIQDDLNRRRNADHP